MDTEHPEIPSFLGALRCTCGKARGPFCDGSHLEAALGRETDCETKTSAQRQASNATPKANREHPEAPSA